MAWRTHLAEVQAVLAAGFGGKPTRRRKLKRRGRTPTQSNPGQTQSNQINANQAESSPVRPDPAAGHDDLAFHAQREQRARRGEDVTPTDDDESLDQESPLMNGFLPNEPKPRRVELIC